MKHAWLSLIVFLMGSLGFGSAVLWAEEGDKADANQERLAELDKLWAKVSASVAAGDFDGYKSTCHEEGVLVAGTSKKSVPLSKALADWQQGFVDTKEGKMKASVAFRFGQRIGDATTAHETGMFLYSFEKAGAELVQEHIHFEALLVKKDEQWLVLMEYQKSRGTKAEWDKLSTTPARGE